MSSRTSRTWGAGAALTTIACLSALTMPAAPGSIGPRNSQTVVIRTESDALYKPKNFCAEDHTCFTRAHWLHWDRHAAKARANLHVCLPGAACSTGRVTLRYYRVRAQCFVLYSYTRFAYTFHGHTYRGRQSELGPICNWTADYPG